MSTPETIRGRTAVAGVGESRYYRRGGAPVSEFQLACQAILAAVADAGLRLEQIDGLASYSGERNDPTRLAAALGIPELRFMDLTEGGGGSVAAAVASAAAAVHAGYADYVVVYRALAQGQFIRLGQSAYAQFGSNLNPYQLPYGCLTPGQMIALRTRRFMHEHGLGQEVLAAIALASYHHAQFNPRAVMHGRPLTRGMYERSRYIAEPFHLYDCCLENDGAAAVIVTSAERARDLRPRPAYIMATALGADFRQRHYSINAPGFASANYLTVARRLYAMAGIGPKDVDVIQCYDHFTGAAMVALTEHGFCAPEELGEFCRLENLSWPDGRLPLNTSGGNLAECYVMGLELVNEAVRQVRGESTCQVAGAEIALMISGSMTSPTSNLLLHR